jgi:hypothetical protein
MLPSKSVIDVGTPNWSYVMVSVSFVPKEVEPGVCSSSVIDVTSPAELYVYVTVRPSASVSLTGKPALSSVVVNPTGSVIVASAPAYWSS